MTAEFLTCIPLTRRLYDRLLELVCEHYGITRMELDILLFPHNHPGHDTTTDIIRIRHLTKSHVSFSIETLEEQGYSEKLYQGSNGKIIHPGATDKTAEILADGLKIQKTLSNLVLQNFSGEQIANMEKSLKRLIDNVQTAPVGGKKHGL